MSAIVRGTGASIPKRRLTNADLERMVDTSDEWIRSRTGIAERGMLEPEQATSDLATEAAQAALAQAGLAADDVDLVLVATCTSDSVIPSTASLVQRNLRPGRMLPAFDLNAACSGFVYGLEVAGSLIAARQHQRILLIGAEGLTRFIDYEDRGTCVLFGDAAGAAVLEAGAPGRGLVATVLHADGEFWDLIQLPGLGSRLPASQELLERREQYIRMNGQQTFKLAVQAMEQVVTECLERADWKLDDVAHVLVHQANLRIIDAVTDRLGVPEQKVPMNIDRMGNTSAASIPVLLDECNRAGRFEPGDQILCVAFGAGLTWGAAALVW